MLDRRTGEFRYASCAHMCGARGLRLSAPITTTGSTLGVRDIEQNEGSKVNYEYFMFRKLESENMQVIDRAFRRNYNTVDKQ